MTNSYLYSKAIQMLARRDHSIDEVKTKLSRSKQSTPEEIQEIIDKLISQNFLDDHKFASWFVGSRLRSNPKGPMLLQAELRQKKVAQHIIDEVLAQKVTPEVQIEVATQLLSKKKDLLNLPPPDLRKKAYPFLARRGFTSYTINQVLTALID